MKILIIFIILTIIAIIIIYLIFKRRRKDLPPEPKEDIYGYLAEGVRRGFSVRFLKQKLLDARFDEREIDVAIEKLNKRIQPINKKKHLIYGLTILIIIVLSLIIKISLTGGITGNIIGGGSSYSKWVISAILIVGAIVLFLIFRKKIFSIFRNIKEKIVREYFSNKVFDLLNKKVYTDSGEYIGKIEDVILRKNKIDSLKIRLDRKKKYKTKGLVLKYSQVKAVKNVLIVKDFEKDKIMA